MLNFFDCYNAIFSHALVERVAESFGITVRNGCFCNLGAVQQATYTTASAEHCELDRTEKILDCKAFDDKILNKGHCGAIRVSFGLGSNFRDAYCFYLFAKCLLNTESARLEDTLSASAVN
jgi:molybdenum cofactor sulfurtransferase